MENNLPAIQTDITPAKAYISGNTLSALPKKEASKWLNQTLSAAIAMAGQDITPPVLIGLVQGTLDMISKQFKYFTAEEVVLAIKNGTYGMYGDYFKINIKEIGKWLKSYATNERAAIIRKRDNDKLQETLKANQQIKDPVDISARIEQIRKSLTS